MFWANFKTLIRDLQSNFWVDLRILDQPCEFLVHGPRAAGGWGTVLRSGAGSKRRPVAGRVSMKRSRSPPSRPCDGSQGHPGTA
jgi:hypothetical protein